MPTLPWNSILWAGTNLDSDTHIMEFVFVIRFLRRNYGRHVVSSTRCPAGAPLSYIGGSSPSHVPAWTGHVVTRSFRHPGFGKGLMSSSPGSTVSVPPGFAPIYSPMSPVSLFSVGLLTPTSIDPVTPASTTVPVDRSSPVSPALPRSSSSIDSERSDESFYSAVDSPVVRTPAPDPAPVLTPSLFREGPFDADQG